MTDKFIRKAIECIIDGEYGKAELTLREALTNTRSSIRSTSEYSEQAEQEPVFKVGNLVTVNQDPYPALGKLFVQLWDGDDLIARVYADDEQTLHKRVSALNVIKTEQAEQEPVGVVETSNEWGVAGVVVAGTPVGTKLYTHPVRTKDLTDTELMDCRSSDPAGGSWLESARAVIAADREKNK